MNEDQKKSILQMCRGAFMERADVEVAKVIDNIMDANTKPTAKRVLTVTMEFVPDGTRQNISVACVARAKLAPMEPVTTFLYAADKENVVEMAPQIPGQLDLFGGEQEKPPVLKIVKFA